MLNTYQGKRKAITLAVILAGTSLALSANAQEDDSQIEEVRVTGSFIRGVPLDAPSPVQVIDRNSIEAQGAAVLWDVIRNLEVNNGSDVSVAGTSDKSELAGTAQINLRNLGSNATLTLINGKRMSPAAVTNNGGQEFVNINSIPLVMTERVEVLTDGGSALYGSDAVAGVVNIIMRTDFEGFEIYGDLQGVSEAGSDFDKTISGIWGWSSDNGNTHFVLSGEVFDRDAVSSTATNFYDADAGQYNGKVGNLGSPLVYPGATLNPAYTRPDLTALNIAEDNNSARVLYDPLCETLSGPNGPFYIDNRYSNLGSNNATCLESTLDYSFAAVPTERVSIAGSFEHAFADGTEFYAFGAHSETETERQFSEAGSGLDAIGRTTFLFLPPPGTHTGPGSEASSLIELGAFAEYVGNTRPGPDDITNSPLDLRNGGLGTAMRGGTTTGWPRDGNVNLNKNSDMTVQYGLRGDFEISDRAFEFDVSHAYSESSVERSYDTLIRDRHELALQGLGGENCTPNGVPDYDFVSAGLRLGSSLWEGLSRSTNAINFPEYMANARETFSLALTSDNHGKDGCEFFNPLLTSLAVPELANSPELLDWMTARDVKISDKRNSLSVFDAVVSGELLELRGGMAQFAAGAQYRKRSAASRAPALNDPGLDAILSYTDEALLPGPLPIYNPANPVAQRTRITNNLECSLCAFNYDHERTSHSLFLELSLPFLENVETQLAVRYEDYGGKIGSQVSPKLAMSWRPMEELLLRGSWSQSFRAPNIGTVEESFDAFFAVFQDPIRNQDVRAGLLPPTNENSRTSFTFTRGVPNPNLGNETADTFSVGLQWTPGGVLDGFNVGADVWRFEVEDRVLPQIARAALNPEIEKFNSVVGNPDNYIINDSLRIDSANPFEKCDPVALEQQFGRDSDERGECVVDPRLYEIPNLIRQAGSTNANILTLSLPAVNGGNFTVDGIDLKSSYNWDNDWGRFNIGLNYTHVRSYEIADIPEFDLGLRQTGVTDAAGTNGDSPYVNSLPDNKGTISFSWSRGNHRVSVFNRHIGSYKILNYNSLIASAPDRLVGFVKPKVDSYNTWDLQYSYSHAWANSNFGTTNFTVGVIDAFNAELPTYQFQTYDASVFDGRGQRWYMRALWAF